MTEPQIFRSLACAVREGSRFLMMKRNESTATERTVLYATAFLFLFLGAAICTTWRGTAECMACALAAPLAFGWFLTRAGFWLSGPLLFISGLFMVALMILPRTRAGAVGALTLFLWSLFGILFVILGSSMRSFPD